MVLYFAVFSSARPRTAAVSWTETAVQYGNQTGGELVQMIVESVNGVRTAQPAFTEKMRAHAVVVEESSWRQKKSGGTWGAIIRQPLGIASMIGV